MSGRLEVICGPMFAGKSTELIRRLRESGRTARIVLAFKPTFDTRSGVAEIRTHPGDVLEARPIASAADLRIEEAAARGAVIGIDEAHFFGAGLIDPVRRLVDAGARVIVAGVERDHRGRPFEPFPTLLCEADAVLKMCAACSICGGEAVHSQRMVASDAPIMVGGAESYETRCRDCFRPG